MVLQELCWSFRPQQVQEAKSLGRDVGLPVGLSEHVSPMALDEGLALTLCSCDTVWKEAAFLRFSLVPGLCGSSVGLKYWLFTSAKHLPALKDSGAPPNTPKSPTALAVSKAEVVVPCCRTKAPTTKNISHSPQLWVLLLSSWYQDTPSHPQSHRATTTALQPHTSP